MKRALCSLVAALLVLTSAWAAGPATQFTADAVTRTQGKAPIQGRIYIDNGRMRMDTVEGGEPLHVIIRPDVNAMYFVKPSVKAYKEVPLAVGNQHNAYMPDAVAARDGDDRVGAVKCDRYVITSGPSKYVFWVKKGTSVPVAMQTADGKVHVTYANVKLGPPPSSTFDVPAGYKKQP